jgi:hypothetical protein
MGEQVRAPFVVLWPFRRPLSSSAWCPVPAEQRPGHSGTSLKRRAWWLRNDQRKEII